MAKDVTVAEKAVKMYQRELGATEEEIRHVPLHYHIADLVSGLMKLAQKYNLDWKAIERDAKEVVRDDARARA